MVKKIKLYLHEATENLFGVIIYSGIRKANTRTVKGNPCTPFELKILRQLLNKKYAFRI